MNSNTYCLLLGIEKARDRALSAAIRESEIPVALMYVNGQLNNHKFADLIIPGDANRPDSVLEGIQYWQEKTGQVPGAVIPLTEMSIESGRQVANAYNLKYLSDTTVDHVRDKHKMKQAFIDAKLPVAKHATFSNSQQLDELVQDFTYPLVLKPRNAGGSEGVVFVRDYDELQFGYKHLTTVTELNTTRYGLSDGLYQVEEFIEAPHEISVEVLNTTSGSMVCAVTDKFLGDLPFFVELGHTIPSRYSNDNLIRETAVNACKSLGIDRGIAHVEMKIKDDGSPILLEVNARPAGDAIMELAERVTQQNLFNWHIKSYLRDDIVLPAHFEQTGRSSVAFLKARSGLIDNVTLPKPTTIPDEVVGLSIWAQPGKQTQACFDSNGRDGMVELFWSNPSEISETAHLDLANELANQCIHVIDK